MESFIQENQGQVLHMVPLSEPPPKKWTKHVSQWDEHFNIIHVKCTHVLENGDALILFVVKLLLLSEVLVFGGLKTHGDHLRTGQHPVDCPARIRPSVRPEERKV